MFSTSVNDRNWNEGRLAEAFTPAGFVFPSLSSSLQSFTMPPGFSLGRFLDLQFCGLKVMA